MLAKYATVPMLFNPIALRTAKTPYSFGRSTCNRVIIEESVTEKIDGDGKHFS